MMFHRLYSGLGSGFLYVKPDLQHLIHPNIISFGYQQGFEVMYLNTNNVTHTILSERVPMGWRERFFVVALDCGCARVP